jgi:phage replication O-like protein O
VANPQLENGFIPIATELFSAICHFRFPGEERQVFDAIIRQTYGWNKREDRISLSQFVEATGLAKPHIVHALSGLLLKKAIIVAEKGNDKGKWYSINKNYEEWMPLPKKATLPKKAMIIAEKGNDLLPKKGTTINTVIDTTTDKDIFTSEPEVPTPDQPRPEQARMECPHQQIVAAYNRILPELIAVQMWTPARQSILRARWNEATERQTLEWWEDFFGYVKTCPFLMGKISNFRADLEWLIRPKNFPKVLEGKYDDRKNQKHRGIKAWLEEQ